MPRRPRPLARLTLLLLATLGLLAARARAAEDLFDWSDWEKYRATVRHPSGAIKPADLTRARENLRRYDWARAHLASLERAARAALPLLTPAYLDAMIPDTTPGDPKFTPCPACRVQGKPVHPHGLWSWSPASPDRLVCDQCRTAFPDPRYPEDVVLRATWRRPQTLTFLGGEPFEIFSYKTGRPSFTANIRARKVAHLAGLARTLAEAHLLTGDPDYARGVRLILLRFAAAYPGWLVHTGYGEYADIDPRLAAQSINRLPSPELCPPPNLPDRRLHTGYWTAGRASGVGQESHFVRRVVEAYDFTCEATDASGSPLYSDADRRLIERDLLLESTLLLVSDPAINNKSVGNRSAAALVGLCVGHPGLVRFGWDGFQRTIDEWFLPDGATSESPAYATMTLGNIWDLPQALRGYAEPAGYLGPNGQRRAPADLYRAPAYEKIWANSLNGLQGDLLYPPYADSYRTSGLGSHFVELMAANYPDRPDYLALLKETCGPDLARAHAPTALYYRAPGLETRPSPPLALPDWCPPDLRIGHLRTGADGRDSLLLLSASHWGNHHHLDSLNLSYWKKGAEVLSDLGYLWDHPHKRQTARTLAHNTVLIDERDQLMKERGGEILFFRSTEHVKVMEAAATPYAGVSLYRRASAIIDHGGGRDYVVDFFRVAGGATRDFVYHASAPTCEILGATATPASEKLHDLARPRALAATGAWRARWDAGRGLTAIAWNLPQPGERAYLADGWGQRDWKNSDIGATLPYLVRRATGPAASLFVTVFEAHPGAQPFVRDVRLRPDGVVEIQTALGTDLVTSTLETTVLEVPASDGPVRLTGRFVAASLAPSGRLLWSFTEPAAK